MQFSIGFDLGGTTMSAALVDASGHIHQIAEVDTHPEHEAQVTLGRMIDLIAPLIASAHAQSQEVVGIGIGIAGLVDTYTGWVHTAPNLPQWKNLAVGPPIAAHFQLPVRIDNDVRVAAMGELAYGAGQGRQHLICLTVGTGIGSALILNGQLHRGASLSAGELGHIPVIRDGGPHCGCGSHGCLESVAGTQGILALAQRYIARGLAPQLAQMVTEKGKLTPALISQAATAGDTGAIAVWHEVGTWIGTGLAGVVNLLNPERIIIGGGIAQAGELLFAPIREAIRLRAFELPAQAAELVPAALGPEAGLIGASVLARTPLEKSL
jgi:glucokinase